MIRPDFARSGAATLLKKKHIIFHKIFVFLILYYFYFLILLHLLTEQQFVLSLRYELMRIADRLLILLPCLIIVILVDKLLILQIT